LSQGVPMLLGGDEFARTQHGNNNAWCQDNELSWFDWDHAGWQRELTEFTRRLIALRRAHVVFRRRNFLAGTGERDGLPDVWWFRPDGRRMTQRDWRRDDAHQLGAFLNGAELRETNQEGEPKYDDSFLVFFNAHFEDAEFQLPARSFGRRWTLEVSTADPAAQPGSRSYNARDRVLVEARSVLLLRRDGAREPRSAAAASA
ncbi:MAG: glycogen debranching enzyme, partial [Solirubrobacteraceae bacterium]